MRKLWGIINTQSCKFYGKSAGKNNFENRLRFHIVVAMRFYWDTVYYTGNFDTFKTSVSVNPYCIPIYNQKRICPSIFSQIPSPVSDYVIGFLIYFIFVSDSVYVALKVKNNAKCQALRFLYFVFVVHTYIACVCVSKTNLIYLG